MLIVGIVSSSSAKSYEDWRLLYEDSHGKIEKVYDKQLDQKVVQFVSQTGRDTYITGAKSGELAWNNTQEKVLRWQFNYQESYVIIVSINTLDGYRNLIYTPGEESDNLFYGLGQETINGSWQTITRDLEYDLQRYEPRNTIISVDAFLVRGSGRVAKVELLPAIPGQKTQPVKHTVPVKKETHPKVEHEKESHIAKKPKKVVKSNSIPIITLNGGELIYHKLGEPFFDPGATARDSNRNQLTVDVLGEININKVNRYVLTYLTTDQNGNTATKARVVMVYQPGISQEVPKSYTAQPTNDEVPQDMEIDEEEELILPPVNYGEGEDIDREEENRKQEAMLEFIDQ